MPATPDHRTRHKTTLDQAISDILQRQRDDAQRHKITPTYQGDTGADILEAVVHAENVVRSPRNPKQAADRQVDQLVLDLSDARESWRASEVDEQGFGADTLGKIISDLESLAQDMKSDTTSENKPK